MCFPVIDIFWSKYPMDTVQKHQSCQEEEKNKIKFQNKWLPSHLCLTSNIEEDSDVVCVGLGGKSLHTNLTSLTRVNAPLDEADVVCFMIIYCRWRRVLFVVQHVSYSNIQMLVTPLLIPYFLRKDESWC